MAAVGFFLWAAVYYTWKTLLLSGHPEGMTDKDILIRTGQFPLLQAKDLVTILSGYVILICAVPLVMKHVCDISMRHDGKPVGIRGPFLLCLCIWFPFLLLFYPAPGMTDTVDMYTHSLELSSQFPWAYALLVGTAEQIGKFLFGTREPMIFLISFSQMMLFAGVLAYTAHTVSVCTGNRKIGIFLSLYFAFLPMIGNYAIAAERDTGFSACLLLWSLFLSAVIHDGRMADRRFWIFAALFIGPGFFRSNGLIISVCLSVITYFLIRERKRLFVGVAAICFLLSFVPGQVILHMYHTEPLFQEAAAIPLQQTARVIVAGGVATEEEKEFLFSLLPEEEWKNLYNPFTVDAIKWNRDFNHDLLTQKKWEFMKDWLDMGIQNPRIYAEAWLCETYDCWNFRVVDDRAQSRFGWALTDAATSPMDPLDNDRFSAGGLPLPETFKADVAGFQYEGSRFLGSGPCLWLTVMACVVLYMKKRSRYMLLAAPLLLNTLTLLLSIPGSAVFRYSFSYVIILPVLWIAALSMKTRKEEIDE